MDTVRPASRVVSTLCYSLALRPLAAVPALLQFALLQSLQQAPGAPTPGRRSAQSSRAATAARHGASACELVHS